MFRSGVRAELAADIEIVGEAGTVEEAVRTVAEQQPDVVLLDVHLPGGDGAGGVDVLRGCATQLETTRFLALSVSDAAEDVVAVVRAGRSEEHTSELQSRGHLVCRLLLEKQ